MIRREPYEALGGHGVVAGEVVEDLRLAQELVRAGYRLTVHEAEDALATRMYRSLDGLVEGWSKNLWMASRQTVAPGVAPLVLPAAVLLALGLWTAPPFALVGLALASSLGAAADATLIGGTALATASGLVFWTGIAIRLGAPARYGLLFPVGTVAVSWIAVRSWVGGRRIRWKGRTYGVTTGS